MTVPWPPWVRSTSVWASTSRWRAERTSVSPSGASSSAWSGSPAGPRCDQAPYREGAACGHGSLELIEVLHEGGAHGNEDDWAVTVRWRPGSAHSPGVELGADVADVRR